MGGWGGGVSVLLRFFDGSSRGDLWFTDLDFWAGGFSRSRLNSGLECGFRVPSGFRARFPGGGVQDLVRFQRLQHPSVINQKNHVGRGSSVAF